jgi:hypothetical protein
VPQVQVGPGQGGTGAPQPGGPPLSATKPLFKRPVFWVAAAAVLIVVIIAVAVSAGNKKPNNHHPASAVNTFSTGSTGNTGATTTSTTTVAFAIGAWWDTGVSTDFQALQNDYNSVTTDAGNQDETDLSTACNNMTNDAQKLQTDPPVPDPSINSNWQGALTEYSKAGSECSDAISVQDASELETATTDMTTANSDLSQVVGQLDQYTGNSGDSGGTGNTGNS